MSLHEVTATLHVVPRAGFTIDGWLAAHEDLKRSVILLSPAAGRTIGNVSFPPSDEGFLVDVTYGPAKGANLEDVMRTYRDSRVWHRMADVSPVRSMRISLPDPEEEMA